MGRFQDFETLKSTRPRRLSQSHGEAHTGELLVSYIDYTASDDPSGLSGVLWYSCTATGNR